MNKLELVKYLNEYLKIDDFTTDDSKNGLQVDNNRQDVKKIGYAVDSTSYIFDKAIEEGVDMVICHHGLFWGIDPIVVGPHYNRLSKLIKNDISLYGCHLPLDGHEEVGNNIVMLNRFVDFFKIKDFKIEKFDYSFGVKFENKISLKDFEKYCDSIGLEKGLYNFGSLEIINSVYFSSGGGLFHADSMKEKNYNILITGEGPHRDIIKSKELGQSIILGGHYETEVFGVQALAERLNKKFGIEIVFLDEKY